MKPEEIVQRVDQLKTERSNIESIWAVVERYVMPLRVGNMYERVVNEQSINLFRDDVYDSTGILAAQKQSSAMHGTITNPLSNWFKYIFQEPEMNQDVEGAAWLDDCTMRVRGEMYRANFNQEISSAYQDLVGLGNAIFTCEAVKEDPNDWRGLAFTAQPLRESFFERDWQGNMYRSFRWLQWTSSELKSKFHEEGQIPVEVMARLEKAQPQELFDVIYAVYVRDEKYGNQGKYPLGPLERPVGMQWIFKEGCVPLGTEDGYYEMPTYHCPWERTAGSKWGHGPGMVMAPTIQYINSWLEMEDMALRKMVDPVTLATERAILTDWVQKPGGLVLVRDINAIRVHQSEGRIDLSKMSLQDLRTMVREAFHNDELQLKDSPQMSATEAQIRYELMNRVLGPKAPTAGPSSRATSR